MRNVVEEKKGKRGEVKVWGQGSIYGICQRQIFIQANFAQASVFHFAIHTYIFVAICADCTYQCTQVENHSK